MARARLIALAAWLTGLAVAPLPGQVGGTAVHVLIVTGLSAEPAYAKEFAANGAAIFDAVKARWGVPDSSLIYLAEDPAADRARIRDSSTKANIGKGFETLARRAHPGDVLLVFLEGHGGGEGTGSRVNMPGPDPTVADYAFWLSLFPQQTVVFVNASSGSGDFLKPLSGPNRVIITATKTALESNEAHFADYFARALAGTEADADKDGRISALEAYVFARTEVDKAYAAANHLLTEHSLLDDNGDGTGTDDPSAATAKDGRLARRIAFGGPRPSTDPRVIALLAEQRALEAQLDSLRSRKATMDSTGYAEALEKLLLAIAEKGQQIRALEAGGHQ